MPRYRIHFEESDRTFDFGPSTRDWLKVGGVLKLTGATTGTWTVAKIEELEDYWTDDDEA